MNKFIKNNWQILSLLILAGIFLFVYSFLSFSTLNSDLRFNSPDETANYFFANRFVKTGEMAYYEPQNLLVDDIIRPRSLNSINGKVLPVSFLGMILLYGSIAKIFGVWIILFLTPFLAVAGILFFYFFIRKVFNSNIAYLSSLLLFFCPAYWYYSEKAMYHNVGFVVFLIISLFFLLNKKFKLNILISGFFCGIALTFRTSEIFWIAGTFILLFFYYRKQIKISKIILFVLGILIALSPVFYYNQNLYGSPLANGYSIGQSASVDSGTKLSFLFPFGIDFKLIVKNFYNYFIVLFWFLSLPAILGATIFLKSKKTKKQKAYFWLYVFASIWLLICYGSWSIKDNISYSDITIGNSYTRYWILIYVFALPFMAIFLKKLYYSGWIKQKIAFLLTIIYILFSVNAVFFANEESILNVRKNILTYQKTSKNILSITEKNAIIITEYGDKIFFPKRKVISSKHNDYSVFAKISCLSDQTPVYYYHNLLKNKDIEYINARKISEYKLKLIKVSDGLYRVIDNK